MTGTASGEGGSRAGYREKLRDEVLVIGERIVASEGLDGLQARRLAREARCAVGSLYNVFGDIDDLIAAVNGLTLSRLGEDLATALAGSGTGDVRSRLLALALGYMRFAVTHQPAWKAVFEHRRAAGSKPPQAYVEEQMRLIGFIESVIAPAVAAPVERGRQARALFAAVHGIVSLALDDRLGGIARGELELQVRFIVDVIANGLQDSRSP